ncbi:MAG: hypothetical protein AB7I32_10090 [Gammaproteobacteria bacterium]
MKHTDPDYSPRRRRLLAGSVAAAIGAALHPGLAAAIPAVPSARSASLAALTRTLFPLAVFGEAQHAAAAAKIAERCAADPKLDALVERSLAALPAGWPDAAQAAREAMLRKADPAFVKLLRQGAVGALFGAPEAWPHFGYPGPSLPFGGYLDSKLVDLPWLKEAT